MIGRSLHNIHYLAYSRFPVCQFLVGGRCGGGPIILPRFAGVKQGFDSRAARPDLFDRLLQVLQFSFQLQAAV